METEKEQSLVIHYVKKNSLIFPPSNSIIDQSKSSQFACKKIPIESELIDLDLKYSLPRIILLFFQRVYLK